MNYSYSYNNQEQNPLNQYYQSQVKPLSQRIQGQGTLGSHMSNLMGGMKTATDDYVKRAAGAGIQRGGMNVAGGAPLASQLALQATKGLASNYGNTYGQAAQYANQDRSSQQQLLSQMQSGINSSGGYGRGTYSGNGRQPYGDLQGQADNQAYLKRLQGQSEEDAATKRYRERVGWNQSQDQYAQNQNDQMHARSASEAASAQSRLSARDQQTQQLVSNPGQALRQNELGGASSAPGDPQGDRQSKETANYQRLFQRQQMQNQLSQMSEQQKQDRMKTKLGQLNLSGEEFKQDAWTDQFRPYLAAMGQDAGTGNYGSMNNQRMANAQRATNAWSGWRNYNGIPLK